jgi:hypothetical protein
MLVGGAGGPDQQRSRAALTDAHKAALAVGREEGRAVRRYLEALEAHRPRPGRRRTAESVRVQLAETTQLLDNATTVDRLLLSQRRRDLQRELEILERGAKVDIAALEEAFVRAVPGYSARKGISYEAWRDVGVPARILRKAGITRSG